MPSIVVLSGASHGNFVQLEAKTHVIGRDERCDMQVLDETVSRQHLEVAPGEDGRYVVTVLSANGAKINGHKVKKPTILHDNDIIAVGQSELIFTLRPIDDTTGALTFAAHGQRYRPTVDP